MNVKPGQIYFIEDPKLKKSTHGHPCLVTAVNADSVFICFISSKLELRGFDDLTIEETEDGFSTTGLTCKCFIMGNPITHVPTDIFRKAKYRGFISGALKQRIEKWWGSPLG